MVGEFPCPPCGNCLLHQIAEIALGNLGVGIDLERSPSV
jgi:hypothetical protein